MSKVLDEIIQSTSLSNVTTPVSSMEDIFKLQKMYDMKTEISFKDGKIFTSVSKFSTNFPGVSVQFSGEKMLRLYNREEPTGVKCEIMNIFLQLNILF